MQLKTKIAGVVAGCALIGAIGCTPDEKIDYAAQYEEKERLKNVLFSATDTNQDRKISTEEVRAIALRCGYQGYFSEGVETLLDFEYSDNMIWDTDIVHPYMTVTQPYRHFPYEKVTLNGEAVKDCFKQ